jgi:hypothetical protein
MSLVDKVLKELTDFSSAVIALFKLVKSSFIEHLFLVKWAEHFYFKEDGKCPFSNKITEDEKILSKKAYLFQKTGNHEDYRFLHFLENGSNTKESFSKDKWKIPLGGVK